MGYEPSLFSTPHHLSPNPDKVRLDKDYTGKNSACQRLYCNYRCLTRDRNQKNMLAYNEFAYKKTKDDCKVEDRFQKNDQFSVTYTQNCR